MIRRSRTSRSGATVSTERSAYLLLFAVVFACASVDDSPKKQKSPPAGLPERELSAREALRNAPIEVSGTVRDSEGVPVAGAAVELRGSQVLTAADGTFRLPGLTRDNGLLELEKQGFRPELLGLKLHQPIDVPVLELDPIILDRIESDAARFLHAGDAIFGRRFLSTVEQPLDHLPADDPAALIQPSGPEAGSKHVLRHMRPLFQLADFASLNLETVVTDQPKTPYQGKPFVFFSLPGSLPALPWLGVDYVSLANNHMYDYLEAGVKDTRDHLAGSGVLFSGAGQDAAAAFIPVRMSVGGQKFSQISLLGFSGSQYDTLFIATDEKGGAAYAHDSARHAAVLNQEVAAGQIPIVHLHAGIEYADHPSQATHDRMHFSVDNGAALVVGHHPHVGQAFEWYKGKLIAHSLGNFLFDQQRHETTLGLLARIDQAGETSRRAIALPIQLDNFEPRVALADLANVFLRHIGDLSRTYGAHVYPYLQRGYVSKEPSEYLKLERVVELDVKIDAHGIGIIDLRQRARSDESLARLETEAAGLSGKLGRDLLRAGGIEDLDVDEDTMETARWWFSGSGSFPCVHETQRGAVAMCLYRRSENLTAASASFRNRVRVRGDATHQPEKDLGIVSYLNAENAGQASIAVRYYAGMGPREFGQEEIYSAKAGANFEWTPFYADISMPADDAANPKSSTDNARALRVFVEHGPPVSGEGYFRFDDVAIVSWEEAYDISAGVDLDVPHPRDFVRVAGPEGSHRVRLTLHRWVPLGAL